MQPIFAAVWKNKVGRWVTVGTGVFAFFAAFGGAVGAWPSIAAAWHTAHPALYYEIEEVVDKRLQPVRDVQANTTLSVDRLLKFWIEQSLAAAKADPGAATSPIVKERIKQLEEQYQATDARIRREENKR